MLRGRPASKGKGTNAKGKATGPKPLVAEDFVNARDFTGALALLEFKLKSQDGDTVNLLLWIGYCAYHLGRYERAVEVYRELLEVHEHSSDANTYLACCLFLQQEYEQALQEAHRGADGPLKTRVLFNLAHRLNDEEKLMSFHKRLQETKEDQLSLGAIHYLRSHFQEVIVTVCNVSICIHVCADQYASTRVTHLCLRRRTSTNAC
jgi:intraflagellar transport protein 56